MKILVSLLFLISYSFVFACDLQAPRIHQNPDGSVGGLVDFRTVVSPETYIGRYVQVCGSNVIEGINKIDDFVIINGQVWIKGFVEITDYAQILDDVTLEGEEYNLIRISDNVIIKDSVIVSKGSVISGFSELSMNQY